MKLQFYFSCIAFCFFSSALNAQIIPANKRVDWLVAGYQGTIPSYTNIKNILAFGGSADGSTPNDAALQAAITSLAGDNGVIFFPAGTYLFINKITLRSGVVLRGQDAASTTLKFNLSGTNNLINIEGSYTNSTANVTASAAKSENTVTVDDATPFQINDYVKLYQNDSSLIYDSYALKTVGQILRIQNIVGNTITFYHPLRKSYSVANTPKLIRMAMTTGVGIECLKIKRMDLTNFQTANIVFQTAAQCWVKGIESDSCNFAHVEITNSTNISVSGSYFHGSFGYGSSGQGYGFSLESTSGECLIENNVFKHLRHAMVVQMGANGNVFAYNYSREAFKSESFPFDLAGDIVCHGNYPYANLFEGNIVQNIVLDAAHGLNGPNNTMFRNRAELYGILMTSGATDSTNIVGNEITGAGSGRGFYIVNGNGNFEYGNNKNDSLIPTGTSGYVGTSYYYTNTPAFWNVSSPWPSLGSPNASNSGTIPAKQRFDAASPLALCSTSPPLAVHLSSFSAKRIAEQNLITWSADNNNELEKFIIERSSDAVSFSTLSEVIPAASANKTNYELWDKLPLKGMNYYRLIQVKKSGGNSYSGVISVNNSGTEITGIYPNPAKDKINIVTTGSIVGTWKVTIRNNAGQALIVKEIQLNNNTYSLNIHPLTTGIYTVELVNVQTGFKSVYKFIKE